jgi:hypothetical protein
VDTGRGGASRRWAQSLVLNQRVAVQESPSTDAVRATSESRCLQIRGEAGARQVDGAALAAVGVGATSSGTNATLLRRASRPWPAPALGWYCVRRVHGDSVSGVTRSHRLSGRSPCPGLAVGETSSR